MRPYRYALFALPLAVVAASALSPEGLEAGEPTPTRKLPRFTPKEIDLPLLGDPAQVATIRIRPPNALDRVDAPIPEELLKKGIAQFGWTASGKLPDRTYVMVALTPFAKPTPGNLDKTLSGFKDSLKRGSFTELKFGKTKSGMLNGVEVRTGSYTALVDGEPVVCFFLIGIDEVGTFLATAMMELSSGSADLRKAIAASLLTITRVASEE